MGRHTSDNDAVPVPSWALLSGEQKELDIFVLQPDDVAALPDLRCNALLVLHETATTDTAQLADTLDRIQGDIPITLVGQVPQSDVKLSSFGLQKAEYHYWSSQHAELAKIYAGVYATTFASPGLWGEGFHAGESKSGKARTHTVWAHCMRRALTLTSEQSTKLKGQYFTRSGS